MLENQKLQLHMKFSLKFYNYFAFFFLRNYLEIGLSGMGPVPINSDDWSSTLQK